MSQEEFLLKWNDHHNSFFSIMKDLCESEVLTDVTLACGGQVFETHKLMLCACSTFFRSILTKRPDRHPIVFLKDVDPKQLEQLLQYMYQGEINVLQEDLSPLIETARALQVKGLADAPAPPASQNNTSNHKRRDTSTPPLSGGSPAPPPLKKARNPLLNNLKSQPSQQPQQPKIPSHLAAALAGQTTSHLANRLSQPKSQTSSMPFVPLLPTVPEPPVSRKRPNDTNEDLVEMWGQPEVAQYDGSVNSGIDQDLEDEQFNEGGQTFASPRLSHHNNSNNKSSGDIKAAANDGQQQTGRRRYPCMECGKAFVTPSKLLRHIYSHSGIRPFMCNVCGKSFSQSANLKTHVKNTHPESCTQILVPTPESMSTDSVTTAANSGNSSGSGDYESSVAVKSEVSRPFMCNLCTKTYSESESLKNHIKNTHPDSCTKVLIPTTESMTTAQHSSSAAAAAAMASLAASQQECESYTTASNAANNPPDDEDDDIADHQDESDY